MTGFSRYEGADLADSSVSMPADLLNPATSRLSIGELLGHYEDFCNSEANGSGSFPWAKGFALGYPLPEFQRNQVWSTDQSVRFIESIWAGIDIGTYLVNDAWEINSELGDAVVYRKYSYALLDGQQRLTAIQRYVTNCFSVPDANGTPRFWREIGRTERRRFCRLTFTKATISSWDEELLFRAYDLRAFGGTPHNENERASQ